MYSSMIKQFVRSRMVWISFLLILSTGIVGILTGKQFLDKQKDIISKVTHHQQEHIQRNVAVNDEMGLLLYYLRFALINKPDPLTALSIGQRDVNPSIQSVTIRTLEGQKYDTELNNPSNLQSGNLDLGFVIIYLFPLLTIAFTFNLLSEEIETGTWRLVAVQSRSTLQFLFTKLSVRALFLYAALLVLFALAIVILSLPLNNALFGFILISIFYLAFWFALSFLVASFKRSSSFNVLTLLSAWVTLVILIPASVNNYVANQYPIPESLSTMVKQRDGYHEKWDMDKKVTMEKFYAHYPQFKKYGVPEENFNWLLYYAMQQMGDDESLQESKEMRNKILLREDASRSFGFVIPTMHAQLLFNDLAKTSLRDHLLFLDKTNAFHEKMKLYFYPKIFANEAVQNETWSKFKPEYVSFGGDINWLILMLPFLISTAGMSLLAYFNLKQPSGYAGSPWAFPYRTYSIKR
jgi:ABC-2 type transport system permease protein